MKSTIAFFILAFVLIHPANADTSPGGRFDFHVNPWVSLHHTAYHFERAARTDLKLRGRVPVHPDDDIDLVRELRKQCPSLATAYDPYVATSILFSPDTRRIAKELTSGPDALTDRRVAEALEDCMPAYKKTLWPSHKAAATAFVDRVMGELERYEDVMSEIVAKDVGICWPDDPVRVDVVPYANWAGAYTDIDPANVTISYREESLSGKHAFEMLFHEAGHTPPVDTAITNATETAMQAAGLENPRIPHYVLFHVMGHAAEQALADEGYVAYVKATGLSEDESSRDIYAALAAVWDRPESLEERLRAALEMVVNGEPSGD